MILGVAVFALIQLRTFSTTLPILRQQLGELSILDTRFPWWNGAGFPPWNSETAAAVMATLGKAGRQEYLQFVTGTDLVFSVLVMPICFMAVLTRLYKTRIFLVGALPGVFDTIENVAIAVLITAFPVQPSIAVMLGPYATGWKFLALAVSLILIGAGIALKLIGHFVHRSAAVKGEHRKG